MKIFKQISIAAVLVLFLLSGKQTPAQSTDQSANGAIVITNGTDAAPVAHAIEKLAASLGRAGHEIQIVDKGPVEKLRQEEERPEATLAISVGIQVALPFHSFSEPLPDQPESYSIGIQGNTVFINGSDAVGAMYGVYDVMEQIEMNGPNDVEYRARSPYLKIRAVNPFFHIQAFEDQNSWQYDEYYWKTYLDELSLSRCNLLDIHAMYDLVSTGFPNAFLYLMKSDQFPDVGVSEEQARINLDMFNRIIELADERGIRVSLMSYHASWEMPGREGVKWPSDDELADYTAEMVRKLIDRCPKLWMIGFRIGESGREADFFEKSYIRGIREASREINLSTRTWAAPPEQVLTIAEAYPGKTYYEIKYNGEQLGLPWHTLTSTTVDYNYTPSYSYEAYTDWPRKYEILWQIRANGTHRLFRWGDPEFARRVALSCRFSDGAGFTMEPMTSYYPPTDFFHKDHSQFDYFTWDHQRNWFWYEVWGRESYDPETPEAVWINMFEKRFGDGAGRDVYETLVWNSRIVPLIFAYRFMGPDHRQMAPEYEFGGSLIEFATSWPLDAIAFKATENFADEWIERRPKAQRAGGAGKIGNYVAMELKDTDPMFAGKTGPLEVADMLDRAIQESERAALRARAVLGASSKEFNDIDLEHRMLASLGGYYAEKLRAAVHWSMFMKSYDPTQLRLLDVRIRSAHAHWDDLASLGEQNYRPLLDKLRMHTLEFTWREEQKKLGLDLDNLNDAYLTWENYKKENADKPVLTHLPPYAPIAPGKPFEITAGLTAPVDAVSVHIRDKAGRVDYETPMKEIEDGVYSATIPGQYIKDGILGYSFRAEADGETYEFPKAKGKEKAAMHIIEASSDTSGPVVEPLGLFDVTQNSGKLRVRATDFSGVKRMRLYHKPIPSQLFWSFTEMKPTADDPDVYEAEVDLTPHGLLYYFVAEDNIANGSQFPDGMVETPYMVLDSWRDPEVNPYLK